jgi:hypothetical protein
MLSLSADQIQAITNALRPLQPAERIGFQAALFDMLLHRRSAIGDGELGRTLRELQQRHFRPPTGTETGLAPRAAQTAAEQKRPGMSAGLSAGLAALVSSTFQK